MHWLRFGATAVPSLLLILLFNLKLGPLPPVGKLLSPFGGFWEQAEGPRPMESGELKLPGLKGKVTVLFDDRLVPHIFAENEHDLYVTQGYLTARFRLWQMDLQTRFAGGRLAEVLGPDLAETDLFYRRNGMVKAAEAALVEVQKDPESYGYMQAYADGVNAYVNSLSYADLPLEYKLMDFEPTEWSPLRTALLLKYMAWDLSSESSDWAMSHVLAKLGPQLTQKLYPNYPHKEDPIIPRGTEWDFKPMPAPGVPDNWLSYGADTTLDATIGAAELPRKPDPDNGSNNWAVAGSKTAAGRPMIANDPHLSLNLPSIWFEVQLVCPTVNVYGVSLPGAPGVVIGFNKDIAWGVTNVGSDVRDFYRIRFKDASRNEYWHDNQWKKVERRVETVKVRGEADRIDTVLYTHHGPVPYLKPKDGDGEPAGMAVRWLALEPSNDFRTFWALNHARNYDEYVAALATYVCPAQNFCFISRQGDIALWANGRFPLKWAGQGKFISDGTDPRYDWQGWIPQPHNPHVKNPKRGFVSSANQQSADETYPYYLDWHQVNLWRGARINQRLAAMSQITPDSLRAVQNDNYSLMAEMFLGTLLQATGNQPPAYTEAELKKAGDGVAEALPQAYAALKNWNLRNDPDQPGATVFNRWLDDFMLATLEDELGQENVRYPDDVEVALAVMADSNFVLLDDVKTPKTKENLRDIARKSFLMAVGRLHKRLGAYGEGWQWGAAKNTCITHLAKLTPFSRSVPGIGGGEGIVNATKSTHGPSWRMVVQVGDTPTGFGIYPGGQSGNPGSRFYDNFIPQWGKGELAALLFLTEPKLPEGKELLRLDVSTAN